jgi:hypothetical protein
MRGRFIKVMPLEYQRAWLEMAAVRAKRLRGCRGCDGEAAALGGAGGGSSDGVPVAPKLPGGRRCGGNGDHARHEAAQSR